MFVRLASLEDVKQIVSLADRVQRRLSAVGSAQIIGPLDQDEVARRVRSASSYVLSEGQRLIGSVFIERATGSRRSILTSWGLSNSQRPLWFLENLMIEPAKQGQGLGRVLLDAACVQIKEASPAAVIALDCWAGNEKLRSFYTAAGFRLHGIFPEMDYEIAVFTMDDG